jgi:phage terminase large subunit
VQYRGANWEAITARDGEVIVSGPAGTGKSLACLHKLHWMASTCPGFRALIVRKTRESLTESALASFENKVLSPSWRAKIVGNTQRRFRQSYKYPDTNSYIVVGGLDKPSKVMSTEYDMIYVNETIEASEDDWESLSTRLRNNRGPYHQLIGDTNPGPPSHWIKQRANAGKLRLIESRHQDNPGYWDRNRSDWTPFGKKYLKTLDALTGVRRLRLLQGIWAGVEGQVYDEWDESVHLVDQFDVPPAWPRYRSVDFGYTNPFVCQWWASDPDGRLCLYRELYGTGRLVSDWAIDINRHSAGESVEWTVADHDAEDRATLDSCGIPTLPAHKAVKPGIEAVQKRLRRAGDGKPRLFVLKGCTVERDSRLIEAKKPASTVEEFPAYVWAPTLPNRAMKEEPTKVHDHGMDALRYLVAEVDGLGHYSAGAY